MSDHYSESDADKSAAANAASSPKGAPPSETPIPPPVLSSEQTQSLIEEHASVVAARARKRFWWGMFLALCSALVGGFYPIGLSGMTYYTHDNTLITLIYMSEACVLSLILSVPLVGQLKWSQFRWNILLSILLISVLLLLGNRLLAESVGRLSPAVVQTLTRSETIFVIILSIFFLREPWGWYTLVGTVLLFTGLPLLASGGGGSGSASSWLNLLLPLGAGAVFSVMTVFMRFVVKSLDISILNTIRLFVSTGILILLMHSLVPVALHAPWPIFAWALLAAATGPILFRTFLYRAAVYIGLSNALIIGSTAPVATAFYQIVLQHRVLHPLQWLGIVVVILGIALITHMSNRRAKLAAAPAKTS